MRLKNFVLLPPPPPNILWPRVFDEVLVLLLVTTHVANPLLVGQSVIEDHDERSSLGMTLPSSCCLIRSVGLFVLVSDVLLLSSLLLLRCVCQCLSRLMSILRVCDKFFFQKWTLRPRPAQSQWYTIVVLVSYSARGLHFRQCLQHNSIGLCCFCTLTTFAKPAMQVWWDLLDSEQRTWNCYCYDSLKKSDPSTTPFDFAKYWIIPNAGWQIR